MAQGADGARRIIELGAGTGAITEVLCERHPRTPTTVVPSGRVRSPQTPYESIT